MCRSLVSCICDMTPTQFAITSSNAYVDMIVLLCSVMVLVTLLINYLKLVGPSARVVRTVRLSAFFVIAIIFSKWRSGPTQ